MGQAFDRDGGVLGEAFGATKREVFDKLMKEHSDAHEIRIKTMEAQGGGANNEALRRALDALGGPDCPAMRTEMPRYRCHKEVWALKIERIEYDSTRAQAEGRETDGSAVIVPADAGYGPFRVDGAYLRKHNPHFGGYYIVYKDGYKSFSPADAFEDGYTRF